MSFSASGWVREGLSLEMLRRWKNETLTVLLMCFSKERNGSNKTPRLRIRGEVETGVPSMVREKSCSFVSWGFGPMRMSSVFSQLSLRKLCCIQVLTCVRQFSMMAVGG